MANKFQNNQEIHSFKLKKFSLKSIFNALLESKGTQRYNKSINKYIDLNPIEYIDKIFDELNIDLNYLENDLKKIPKKGAFVVIANHPMGALDYLLLIRLISVIRPDFKIISKFQLKKSKPISKNLMVEESDYLNEKDYSYSVFIEAYQNLQAGIPVGIFPTAETANFNANRCSYSDKNWLKPVMKLIKYCSVPVVPIFISIDKDFIFKILKSVYPNKSLPNIGKGLPNKKKHRIDLRIGNPITIEEQNEFIDMPSYSRYLRAKTDMLKNYSDIKSFYFPINKQIQPIDTIIKQKKSQDFTSELKNLKDNILVSYKDYNVYFAESAFIPNILNEIGRLRKITTCENEVSADKSVELDEYDLYYNHILLWDKNKKRIAGAFRIGKGLEIHSKYGKKGFYLNNLYKFSGNFTPFLQKSMEFGFPFIIEEDKNKDLPLFLLCKSLIAYLGKFPEYQYLIGTIGISDLFLQMSVAETLEIINDNYFNQELSNLVKPKKPFKPDFMKSNEMKLESANEEYTQKDKTNNNSKELSSMSLLLKNYAKDNSKFISFNLNPNCDEIVEGFLIIESKVIRLSMLEKMRSNLNLYN